jgi:hypothetical protein
LSGLARWIAGLFAFTIASGCGCGIGHNVGFYLMSKPSRT